MAIGPRSVRTMVQVTVGADTVSAYQGAAHGPDLGLALGPA